MFDPHIADATGGLAANADAGEAATAQCALGDQHVLRDLPQTRAVQAATGFQADGIIARVDVAPFDADIFAGIDVNAVATAVDVHVFYHNIGAVSRVRGPIAALRDGESFPADVVARDGLKDDNPTRVLRGRDGGISFNATRANDSRVVNICRINERATPRLPAPFPTDVHHRIIICIRAAGDDAVCFEPETGVVADLHAADEIFADGDKDFAATGNGADVERFLEGDRVLVRAITNRAKVTDVKRRFRRGVSAEKRDREK